MLKPNETVQRINRWYVSSDCIQTSVPYQNSLTIFNKDGILYHHNRNSDTLINRYLQDERRKQFPYSNIPWYYSKKGYSKKYRNVNQIFNLDEPYIRVEDGNIIESYAVKDNQEALLIKKRLSSFKKTGYKTREQLEKILAQPEEGQLWFFDLQEVTEVSEISKISFKKESEIYEMIKNKISKNVADLKEYTSKNPGSMVGDYLRRNPQFLDFVEQSTNLVDQMEFNYPMTLDSILLVKTSGDDITLEALDIYFIKHDYYRVDIYDIPVTQYTLEELKKLAKEVKPTKEPKISLRLNEEITRNDIQRAKQMIKSIKSLENSSSKFSI